MKKKELLCRKVSLVVSVIFMIQLNSFPNAGAFAESDKNENQKAPAQIEVSITGANKFFWDKNYEKARQVLEEVLAEERKTPDKILPRALVNLGIILTILQKPEEAKTIFSEAEQLLTGDYKDQILNHADCLLGLAECHYLLGKTEDSIKYYRSALKVYKKKFSQFSPALLPALEGLGGSFYALDKYKESLPYFRKIAQIDLIKYGASHYRVGKSFNNLADVYYKLNDCKSARPVYSQSVWIFRRNNYERILAELKAEFEKPGQKKKYSQEQFEKIKKRIKDVVLGVEDPPEFRKASFKLLEDESFNESCPICEDERPKDFYNWRLERNPCGDTGFIVMEPDVEPKGVIVCLHGLGLNHQSYKEFAGKIIPSGYCIIAIDVRGFGALSHEKGFDKVDLNSGLEDLTALMSIIRESNKTLPLYLLGESMGGALALQFTAQFPHLVDGLISSVPSGRRFKSTRTKLLVGIRLLDDPNKPFSIGKRVIAQATDKKEVRRKWMNDPGNRLKLSAAELVHFERFMKHNEKYAKAIQTTPVILFQGFKDNLVRPTGTYMLYQALGSSEKDMVFVGSREHLVFEEGQATDDVVAMLVAWLESHSEIKKICGKTEEGKYPVKIEVGK